MRTSIIATVVAGLALTGCYSPNQDAKDRETVNQQQRQYSMGQPVPMYDWSLERDMVIKLYNIRNMQLATHVVWRSDYGMVEGDCAAMGYGIPYDTSLTNPTQIAVSKWGTASGVHAGTIGQAEPNGVYASTNTNATWVMCIDPETGLVAPHYVEAKVTGYPWSVTVDYETNRVKRSGNATVTIEAGKDS